MTSPGACPQWNRDENGECLDHGQPTENARLYAREFAAEQLRKAAKWCEANGYDEAAVDHLIVKAQEVWPCRCDLCSEPSGAHNANPTAGLWSKRNTPSGAFEAVKRSGDVFRGVKREN